MIVVINVDTYRFLLFSDMVWSLEDSKKFFSGVTVPPDSEAMDL